MKIQGEQPCIFFLYLPLEVEGKKEARKNCYLAAAKRLTKTKMTCNPWPGLAQLLLCCRLFPSTIFIDPLNNEFFPANCRVELLCARL